MSEETKLGEFLYFLRIFITPSCWIRNESFDRKWDKSVRLNLKTAEFSDLGEYTVKLNDKEIWIKNRYYSVCYPWGIGAPIHGSGYMPSRRTVFRFFDALERAKANGNIK